MTFCKIKGKCVATASEKSIKIWTEDFSDLLLEVSIDSHCTELVTYNNDNLVIGCINGTICHLNTSERKIEISC